MRSLTLIAIGVGVGVATIMISPLVVPELKSYARPAAKRVLKAAFSTAISARICAAELMEDFEDLIAEAQTEAMEESMAHHAYAASPTPASTVVAARKPATRRRSSRTPQAA